MATKKTAPKTSGTKRATPAKKAAPAKATPKKVAVVKATAKKKAVAPAEAASKKKAVTKVPTANKSTALSKIADLQAQVNELKRDAVGELKDRLAVAKKAVQALEDKLATLIDSPARIKRRRRS